MSNPKVTAEQVEQIRRRAADGERNVALAKAFGLTPYSIGQIVAGKRFASQPGPQIEAGRGKGARHVLAKLDENRVRLIREGRSEGKLYRELAAEAGVSVRAVHDILRGLTWKHIE